MTTSENHSALVHIYRMIVYHHLSIIFSLLFGSIGAAPGVFKNPLEMVQNNIYLSPQTYRFNKIIFYFPLYSIINHLIICHFSTSEIKFIRDTNAKDKAYT